MPAISRQKLTPKPLVWKAITSVAALYHSIE